MPARVGIRGLRSRYRSSVKRCPRDNGKVFPIYASANYRAVSHAAPVVVGYRCEFGHELDPGELPIDVEEK